MNTCNACISIRFICAVSCQTGSVKWITCLIDTERTAWRLTVFSVRFVTCYKISQQLKSSKGLIFYGWWNRISSNVRLLDHVQHIKIRCWVSYFRFIPILQFGPLQPAIQLHVPSVCLHVLQLEEQTLKQSLP